MSAGVDGIPIMRLIAGRISLVICGLLIVWLGSALVFENERYALVGTYCLLGIDHWSTCLTSSEWASWVQAIGTVLAVAVAVGFPIWQSWRTREQTRKGHLETIATDLVIAERQAAVYLKSKFKLPAYRVPLFGPTFALPSLIADGTITTPDATALVQYYVDATSFNFCLDLAQTLKSNGESWQSEVSRIELKAGHLIRGKRASRFDAAARVLLKHLPESSVRHLDLAEADNGEND